jgi:hypothetical protein
MGVRRFRRKVRRDSAPHRQGNSLGVQEDGDAVTHVQWAASAVMRHQRCEASCSEYLIAGEVLTSGEQLHSQTHEFVVEMCQDGSLVVQRTDRPFPLWSTHTDGHPGASLAMLDRGDLVLRSADGDQLWSSGTDGHPGAFLQLHDDGRLVVHDFFRAPLWSSGDA